MKLALINTLYFIVLGFRYFYIYTHDFFTFVYNCTAKALGWNVRFYKAQEEKPDNTTYNKIKSLFSTNKNADK